MSWQFGRIDLQRTSYQQLEQGWELLDPVPVAELQKIYRDYCLHKHFRSVMPMIAGRFTRSDVEVLGYRDQGNLVAWSLYQIWDQDNILSDHFAWNYRNPRLRLGVRSLENECALYRARGYRWMYFEAVEPYMLDMQAFEILGPMT